MSFFFFVLKWFCPPPFSFGKCLLKKCQQLIIVCLITTRIVVTVPFILPVVDVATSWTTPLDGSVMSSITTLTGLQCAPAPTHEYGFCDADWHSVLRLEAKVHTWKSHSKPIDLSSHDLPPPDLNTLPSYECVYVQTPWESQYNANRHFGCVCSMKPLSTLKKDAAMSEWKASTVLTWQRRKQHTSRFRQLKTTSNTDTEQRDSQEERECSSSWQLPVGSIFKHLNWCFELNGKPFFRDHRSVPLNAPSQCQLWCECLWMSVDLLAIFTIIK